MVCSVLVFMNGNMYPCGSVKLFAYIRYDPLSRLTQSVAADYIMYIHTYVDSTYIDGVLRIYVIEIFRRTF